LARVWKGALYVCALGGPASALRAFYTGWLPIYTITLSIAAILICVHCLGTRISWNAKAILLVAMGWSVGTMALLTGGLLGSGALWLVVICMLISMLYSVRIAITATIIATLIVAATGIAFVTGVLTLHFDANAYIRQPSSWASLLLTTMLISIIVVMAIASFRKSIQSLLVEVEHQRDMIAHQATHDQLTGLPTARLADDRLEMAIRHARRTSRQVALMFIDLDGFKAVNDTHGHDAGDCVLAEVGNRLASNIRSFDTAARLGGDEFLVILSEIPDSQIAQNTAVRIIASVASPVMYKGVALTVGCSIGISLFPEHADDARALKRAADIAMYSVKRAGKNGFAYFVATKELSGPPCLTGKPSNADTSSGWECDAAPIRLESPQLQLQV
jgi:diguanylate cyclase (GGDEF)-like protein